MRSREHGGHGDRGSATLEWAILFPALLVLILAIVQAGLWYHARQIALSAAQEGVRAGRAEGAAAQAGLDSALEFTQAHGRGLLVDVAVSEHSAPGEVRIRVSGQALSLVPGVPVTASQEAAGARERFTTASPGSADAGTP